MDQTSTPSPPLGRSTSHATDPAIRISQASDDGGSVHRTMNVDRTSASSSGLEESTPSSESKHAALSVNAPELKHGADEGTKEDSSKSPIGNFAAEQSTTLAATTGADEQGSKHRRGSFAVNAAGRAARQVPKYLRPPDRITLLLQQIGRFCMQNLNFYRVHLLVFTFTPLIFSGIFYASNVEPIAYIDCLFVCVSAMTVTGLTTINISIATPWQQAILFFLMSIGHISAVSILMVLIRRHFFQVKFDSIIRRSAKVRRRMNDVEYEHQKERRKDLIRLQRLVGLRKKHKCKHHHDGEHDDHVCEHGHRNGEHHPNSDESTPRSSASTDELAAAELKAERLARKKERQRKKVPLRADMIRRMDQPAVLINPMGAISTTVAGREKEMAEDITQHVSRTTSNPGLYINTSRTSNNVENALPTGGILNNSLTEDNGGEDGQGNPDGQAVRIAEPTSPRQARRESVIVAGQQSDSPEHLTEDEEEGLESTMRKDVPSRRRSVVSFRGPAESLSADAANAERQRARFREASEAEGDDTITRLRHGSDPPKPSRHVRHGSDVQTTPRPNFRNDMFPRAQTIEFAEPPHPSAGLHHNPHFAGGSLGRTTGYVTSQGTGDTGMRHRTQTIDFDTAPTYGSRGGGPSVRRTNTAGVPMSRTITMSKDRGFGGFPTPFEVAGAVLKRTLPSVQERFKRSTTMARTATFASVGSRGGLASEGQQIRSAPYLSFDATVSRNSRFHQLSEAQRDELGGVEYRAIDMLSKLIPIYWLGLYFFFIVLVAPWLAAGPGQAARDVLATQGVHSVGTTWFWFFQCISAYSNTGLSLIDTSMIQLNSEYMMLIPIAFLILAGNTAFPIFLRFFIWVLSHLVPQTSRTYETLRFLLDHPRRCFVYLFPSAQTWFLLLVLVVLNSFDWIMFEVLDLGNPAFEMWSTGVRVFDGLFQSIAVRAAGFQIVSLLALAPAVQFLYIVMMYISAYPVAMSVRNTNVYEERSLGIFNDSKPGTEQDDEPSGDGGARIWGTYLAAHARRQLAFDMWWLGFALWLICIIERENIQDPNTNGWFTVFSCLFELTSAYGTVGLSTGTPVDNFSLSGRFHTLSKLVVIAVMLRGRHRGLPVAIDRAVLLPDDFEVEDDAIEKPYTIDEDGMIRSRSTYFASGYDGGGGGEPALDDNGLPRANSFLPRTPTSASVHPLPGGTPRMAQHGNANSVRRLSRERSFPTLDLDSPYVGEEDVVSPDGAHWSTLPNSAPASSTYVNNSLSATLHHHHLSAIREASGTPLPTPSSLETDDLKLKHSALHGSPPGSLTSTTTNSSQKGKEKELSEKEGEFARRFGSADAA